MTTGSPTSEVVERLRKLMKRAEPLPWVWEQCGEKEDCPVVGVAFDRDDRALAGMLRDHGDEIMRFNIASEWGSGIEPSAPSANADFVVSTVNALPEIFTLLQSLEARIEEKDVALAKCRDKFAEYASQHEAKARAANPGGSSRSMNTEAAERWAKAKRNQEMADLCSAALTPSNRDRM